MRRVVRTLAGAKEFVVIAALLVLGWAVASESNWLMGAVAVIAFGAMFRSLEAWLADRKERRQR